MCWEFHETQTTSCPHALAPSSKGRGRSEDDACANLESRPPIVHLKMTPWSALHFRDLRLDLYKLHVRTANTIGEVQTLSNLFSNLEMIDLCFLICSFMMQSAWFLNQYLPSSSTSTLLARRIANCNCSMESLASEMSWRTIWQYYTNSFKITTRQIVLRLSAASDSWLTHKCFNNSVVEWFNRSDAW